ncbi:C4-dicarboxylate ABC transporter permease [Candidatus Atribacteria bacterium HGW-Atribacteria-1]|nr:MAG: C4-dicarboxylate ABC transporter permease [Candidatus Atribacteria bacterium HGW-Atribacteria-1]
MRQFSGWRKWVLGGWLVAISLFQLYTAFFGILQPRLQRGIHLLFLLPMAFILFPTAKRSPQGRITITDALLAFLAMIPPLYLIVADERLNFRLEFVDPVLTIELLLGILNIILLLEAIRRAVVPAMAALVTGSLIYMFIAPYLPGVFYCKPISFFKIVEMQYLITDAGIYGSITGVSATFVALFIIFGAFMENTKTGEFFTNLACRVAGTSQGGPAKIAVISSGLFGSISGVAAANVYATGTFTIPLMKKLGYRKQFAGAVEAAASTGGMIMPPVMGAGAFVMAEITGIPYVNIIIAAALGAVFYYISVGLRVHFTALKEGLRGLDKKEVISVKQILRDTYLLIPLIGLVYLLLTGYSPFMAAFIAILLSFVISFFRKDTMMTPRRLWATLELGGRNMIMIALACAGAGMVVSMVTHTGLGLGMAAVIVSWSKGILLPALGLIMITSLILGMGLPCTPAYIIAVTIGGPALLGMGCDLLSAHLFVFYFAILASVTPPVCIAAYCGAAIAGSEPLRTGFEAFKLAIVGFIVPYIFVYNPALLLSGSVLEILTVVVLLLFTVILLDSGLTGYLTRKLNTIERVILIVVAVGLAILNTRPSTINLTVAGIIVITLIIIEVVKQIRRRIIIRKKLIEETSRVEGSTWNEEVKR